MEKSGNFYIEEAESDFKRVHKSIILNKGIDCLTLGIYVKILVLGKKWQLNIKGLSSYFGISDMKIRRSISLLEHEGYISRKAVQDEKSGKLSGWNYTVHAIPLDKDKRTSAGKKSSDEVSASSEDRVPQKPTTRFSDNTETGEDNNNKHKEDINLNNHKKEEDKSSSKKDEKTWRNDFDTYLAEVYKAMDELLKDNEYRVLMTSYYPNIDYDKTIDKSVKCYWGTYFGWEQKKKNKRVKNIDMLSTLKKNFDKSKVYKPRSFSKQEQDNDKMYHSKKRDAGSVYHDYAGYGTERYRRFIKWLSDNATYIYEHYTYLITLNQFTEMVKVEGIAESMSEIILALAANPTEYGKYDNLYEYVKEKLHEQR